MDGMSERGSKVYRSHLLEEIEVKDVAAAVYMSPFYFQKGFSIMTGYSVGEYIRQRRCIWQRWMCWPDRKR